MWRHYCPIEKTWISVGKDEPCNWCEAKDKPSKGNIMRIPYFILALLLAVAKTQL